MTEMIRSYLVLVVIMAIFGAMIPNENMKKYIGFFSGLIMSVGILLSFAEILRDIGLSGEEISVRGLDEIIYESDQWEHMSDTEWLQNEVERVIEGIISETEESQEE